MRDEMKWQSWLRILLPVAGAMTLFCPWVYTGDDPNAISGLSLATYIVHGEDNTYLLGKFPKGWFAMLFPLTVAIAMAVAIWTAINRSGMALLFCSVYVFVGLIVYLNLNNYLDNPHFDTQPLGFAIPHGWILVTLATYALIAWNTAESMGWTGTGNASEPHGFPFRR